jgi:hypothetical protein
MRISENVRAATGEDGIVLLDIGQGQMFTINPVGSRIWHQLKDGRSLEEIAEGLATDFGIAREQARSDTDEFVKQLETRQLIRTSESEDSGAVVSESANGFLGKLLQRWRPNTSPQAPAR